ncbi:FAD-dependent oxidoreductase [Cohnella faecalis]|uniref:FAD-dependent oxidoreductase n=1 Tax=Cohnella faecalis TaxID=2315694 RepID=A0A398CBN8_9BACL|nr:FAD-dependent oxidoreductase [Cohnella faecalis]RIE00190.1 FAD-dependent oxidoreductase [Cohnella faecalis]
MSEVQYKKSLAVKKHYDVIVAGSGPAGICAAVAAAREGATVALIERYGVLGGNLTMGHVGPVLGSVAPGGLRDELMGLLGVPDNDYLGVIGVAHDGEKAKRVITNFVRNAGVDIYLQSPICDVIMDENKLSGLVISGKKGMYALTAEITLDATGDGDIAFFSGAGFQVGRTSDGLMQPVTLEFTINGVDESRAIACIGEVDDVMLGDERFNDFTARCVREGLLPEVMTSVRLHRTVAPGERRVNTTQSNGIDATDVKDLIKAEVELRNQMNELMIFLRKYVPGYENSQISSSANTLGVRETRRFIGEYILTDDDLAEGRKFEDAIVHNANFIVDIHNPIGGGQAEGIPEEVQPYDIPYRCFIPVGVDNLILTGRCISGTHRAHASYRVMSICMAMGQGTGIAAALSVKDKTTPRLLNPSLVRSRLMDLGVQMEA